MTDDENEGVLVTGASSGIGRAVALELARRRRRLFLTGRDPTTLREVAERCGTLAGETKACPSLPLDLTQKEACRRLLRAALQAVESLGVWIHAAGIGFFGTPEEHDDIAMRDLVEINFLAATRLTALLLPHFRERQRGHLVYVLSVAAKRPFPHVSGYAASKHALRGYAESLRQDLRGTGINITCALPVATRTPFWDRAGYENWEQTHARTAVHEPELVARRLVRALEARPREWFPDLRSRVLDFGQRLSPRLLEWLTARGSPPVEPRFRSPTWGGWRTRAGA